MTKFSWSVINRKIKDCISSRDPLECLLRLFQETDDGWVAFHIGNILKDEGRLEEALNYYKKAYERLPLPKYKDMAKSEIEKLENELVEKLANNRDILYIVTCTEKKIWAEEDAPKYVPAKEAYIGSTMKKWLKSEKAKKYPWLIFSSKYGFIEPDHPIKNYDIHFIEHPGAVSEETILRQILHQKFDGFKIVDFNKVYFVGSENYFRKLKSIFMRAGMELERYGLSGEG
jgi:tetratricopeptide (TPR) repeat protein